MKNLVTIVVVNWNSGVQLNTCLRSIREHGNGYVSEVIVVDNGSVDGSARCASDYQDVELILTGQNLGFGKACNLGACAAKSQYLLFLNPDAALFDHTLGAAVSAMEDPSNSQVGICGVQLVDELGVLSKTCSRFPSACGFVSHSLGLDRWLPQSGIVMAEWDHSDTREVDQIIGAFFFVRRDLFESLHGFDERFFVYFEEVDFSFRALQLGWSSLYLANGQAFHAGGGTSNQIKARRLFYSLRSRVLYIFAHFSLGSTVSALIATLLVEPVARFALALARGSWIQLKEAFLAYGMLSRWLIQIAVTKRARKIE